MCESIGHRPLRGRCPKTDRPVWNHRSLAPPGPLPLSSHLHLHQYRGIGYRWQCNAFATFLSPLSFSFWAAAPKGTKSCRTQGDFRSSVHPSVIPSFRPYIPPIRPLRPEIYPLRPEIYFLRPEICPLRPWIYEGMNGWIDKRKSPCVLQDFVSFGAAAQKADLRTRSY